MRTATKRAVAVALAIATVTAMWGPAVAGMEIQDRRQRLLAAELTGTAERLTAENASALALRTRAFFLLANTSAAVDGDRLRSRIEATNSHFLGPDRVDSRVVFAVDQAVANETARVAPEIAGTILAADRRLAETALADARRVRDLLRDRNATFDEHAVGRELELAEMALAQAEQVEGESPAGAVEHYRRAWSHAQRALDLMNGAFDPVVTLRTRGDPDRNGTYDYTVRGRVFDVRAYALENVTVLVDGEPRATAPVRADPTPGTPGNFTATVPIEAELATVRVVATDDSGPTANWSVGRGLVGEHPGQGPPDDRGQGPPDDSGQGPPDDRGQGPPEDRGQGPPDDRGQGPPGAPGEGPPDNSSRGPPGDDDSTATPAAPTETPADDPGRGPPGDSGRGPPDSGNSSAPGNGKGHGNGNDNGRGNGNGHSLSWLPGWFDDVVGGGGFAGLLDAAADAVGVAGSTAPAVGGASAPAVGSASAPAVGSTAGAATPALGPRPADAGDATDDSDDTDDADDADADDDADDDSDDADDDADDDSDDADGDSGVWPQTGNATLHLDRDWLSGRFEAREFGFDPLDPDSDAATTDANESGNGVVDGKEAFGTADLPAYVNAKLGADPFTNDTDGDGLTDTFEFEGTGLFDTSIDGTDGDGDGVPDAEEDLDGDGLANAEEQAAGTSPVTADTDGDGLDDGTEVAGPTGPLVADTDGDGLDDGSEVRVGSDPTDPDADDDGVPDATETHTATVSSPGGNASAAVTGAGDPSENVSVAERSRRTVAENPAAASGLVDLSARRSFESARLVLSYDPARFDGDESDLAAFRLNASAGTFERLPSTVHPDKDTVTAVTDGPGRFVVLDGVDYESQFEAALPSRFDVERESFDTEGCSGDCDTVGGGTVVVGPGSLSGATTDAVSASGFGGVVGESVRASGGGFSIQAEPAELTFDTRSFDADLTSISITVSFTARVRDADSEAQIVADGEGAHEKVIFSLTSAGGEEEVSTTVTSDLSSFAGETVDFKLRVVGSGGVTVTDWSFDTSTGGGGGGDDGDDGGIDLPPDSSLVVLTLPVGEDPALAQLEAEVAGETEDRLSSAVLEVVGEDDTETVFRVGSDRGPDSAPFRTVTADLTQFAGETVEVRLRTVGNARIALRSLRVRRDSDGDGLPDNVERAGVRNGESGRVYAPTDPFDVDSDGDGLLDGEEAGVRFGDRHYSVTSNPARADSDGDGLTDLDEVELGTRVFARDTDGDGVTDLHDPSPFGVTGRESRLAQRILDAVFADTPAEAGVNFLKGLVLGDFAESGFTLAYILGVIAGVAIGEFFVIPGIIFDIRDLIATSLDGDVIGAAMAAAGLIPGVSIFSDIASGLRRFADALRASSAAFALRWLYDAVVRFAPFELLRRVAGSFDFGRTFRQLADDGLTNEQIGVVTRNLPIGSRYDQMRVFRRTARPGDELVMLFDRGARGIDDIVSHSVTFTIDSVVTFRRAADEVADVIRRAVDGGRASAKGAWRRYEAFLDTERGRRVDVWTNRGGDAASAGFAVFQATLKVTEASEDRFEGDEDVSRPAAPDLGASPAGAVG